MFRIIEGRGIIFKLCVDCRERYDRYEQNLKDYERGQSKEPPAWVGCICLIIPVGTGIYAMIRNFILGNIFWGFLGLVICPIVIGGIMGILLKVFELLQSGMKPSKPFSMPSVNRLKECDAIIKDYLKE